LYNYKASQLKLHIKSKKHQESEAPTSLEKLPASNFTRDPNPDANMIKKERKAKQNAPNATCSVRTGASIVKQSRQEMEATFKSAKSLQHAFRKHAQSYYDIMPSLVILPKRLPNVQFIADH